MGSGLGGRAGGARPRRGPPGPGARLCRRGPRRRGDDHPGSDRGVRPGSRARPYRTELALPPSRTPNGERSWRRSPPTRGARGPAGTGGSGVPRGDGPAGPGRVARALLLPRRGAAAVQARGGPLLSGGPTAGRGPVRAAAPARTRGAGTAGGADPAQRRPRRPRTARRHPRLPRGPRPRGGGPHRAAPAAGADARPGRPGLPPAYPADPAAPDPLALDQLATDAGARALALLATGEDPIGGLTLWQDAVRLASAHPTAGLTGVARTLYRDLARATGRTTTDLARGAAAWRQGACRACPSSTNPGIRRRAPSTGRAPSCSPRAVACTAPTATASPPGPVSSGSAARASGTRTSPASTTPTGGPPAARPRTR